MKISFGITVCNEYNEIKRLIPFLIHNKRIDDEIVILYDEKNGTKEVLNYLVGLDKSLNVTIVLSQSFNDDFGEWKNKLNNHCSGNYILQLDADEMLEENLVKNINHIIEINNEIDLFYFPRINRVNGIMDIHIKKWGWTVDEKNRINYPDYQGRLYRKGLMWGGKVHEKIIGIKNYSFLPTEDIYSIIHEKDINKQEKQNSYYSSIENE